MNENLNLVEILKDCPKGTILYSPICGEVKFVSTSGVCFPIEVVPFKGDANVDESDDYPISFLPDGRYAGFPNGECLLFPSKDNHDWNTFVVLKTTLPKTWEEFCETHPIKKDERFVDVNSEIIDTVEGFKRDSVICRNVLPNTKYAKAFRALCQLVQLRNCYNRDWEADWTDDNEPKYIISNVNGSIDIFKRFIDAHVLSFKTPELRDEFVKNFHDLLEDAKPLL